MTVLLSSFHLNRNTKRFFYKVKSWEPVCLALYWSVGINRKYCIGFQLNYFICRHFYRISFTDLEARAIHCQNLDFTRSLINVRGKRRNTFVCNFVSDSVRGFGLPDHDIKGRWAANVEMTKLGDTACQRLICLIREFKWTLITEETFCHLSFPQF